MAAYGRTMDTEVLVVSGAQPFAYTYSLAGTFNGRARTRTNHLVLHYTARLWLQQGRYRYEVTDFVFGFPGSGRYPASEIPVESFYNGNFKPLRAEGFRYEMTMRTCFKELADEVLARLQASMRNPISKAGTE